MSQPNSLPPHEVDIWMINFLADEFDFVREVLSTTEKKQEEKYRKKLDALRFERGRGLLRHLIGRYLAISPEKIQIHTEKYGKPRLAPENQEPPLQFNLSHSGNIAIFGFCKQYPIGVDVETVRTLPDQQALVKRFFTTAERASYIHAQEQQKTMLFFHYWTRKEAYLKATGVGLSISPEQVDTAAPPIPTRQPAAFPIQIASDQRPWSLVDINPTEESVAAAVFHRSIQKANLIRVDFPAQLLETR